MNRVARWSKGLRRAFWLLTQHHSKPKYKEMYHKGWGYQQNWGGWSPQLPKNGNKQKKGKGGKPEEKKEEGFVKPYDAVQSSSQSSTGGTTPTPEAAFMKEFMDMMKEKKLEIPERLQRCLPDTNQDAKVNIREQQRRLNRHRNVLSKLENKKRALEKDKESWTSWVAAMKQEVQKGKEKHEETQKRLQKELEALIAEEKKIREQEDFDMEDPQEEFQDPEAELETLLEDADKGDSTHKDASVEAAKQEMNDAIAEIQKNMELKYTKQLELERQQMAKEMDHKLAQCLQTKVVNLETMDGANSNMGQGAVLYEKNPSAPFGVQRTVRPSAVTSPYGRDKVEKTPLKMQDMEGKG